MPLSQFVAIFLSEDIALLQSGNGGTRFNKSRLYFGHYNGSRLQLYGLITNHEQFFGLITNHGLNFETITLHDSKVLTPITDRDKTLYHPVINVYTFDFKKFGAVSPGMSSLSTT